MYSECCKDVEKREPYTLLVGLQIGAAIMESSVVYQKAKHRNTISPSNSSSKNLLKENKSTNLKR